MPLKVNIKRLIGLILSVVLVITAIWVANTIHSKQKCKKVNVVIEGEGNHRLLKPYEISSVVVGAPSESPEGKPFNRINFKKIEQKVLKNPLVKSCQVHRDLSGDMTISVQEHTPIARVINAKTSNHLQNDNYVAEDGTFIGVSPHYTARVLLLSGGYLDNKTSLQDSKSKSIIDLVKFIRADDFWRAQIAQIIIEKDGVITLLPEIGNHLIEFGLAIDLEVKFKKIKILYQEILPVKGWETYKKISVKYRNQIVCE